MTSIDHKQQIEGCKQTRPKLNLYPLKNNHKQIL